MRIFQLKLSDADFVEKTRKQLSSARRRAWLILALSFFSAGLIVYIWHVAVNDGWLEMGFTAGCIVGIITGIFGVKAVIYFAFFLNSLFGNRTEKLLVKYYDQSIQ